jgi:hypothetical protein
MNSSASTNDSPKHKGKGPGEKSAQSPTATANTTTSRRSTPTAYPSNKVKLESSSPHNPGMEIIGIDTLDEEESFAFQSFVFDNESKKLIIEKKDVNNKKEKYHSEINL